MIMNSTRAFAALLAVTFLAAEGLHAQRRGTDGSGSGGRSTPSGGGSRGGTSSGGSRGSGSSGGSSGGSSSRGGSGGSSSGGSSSGSGTRSSGSTRGSRAGDSGSSGTTANTTKGSSDRPRSGKIGAVRRQANTAAREQGATIFVDRGVYLGGSCFDCDYWGWYGRRWGWYQGGYWYPENRRQHWDDSGDDNGQGYDEYPYANGDSADAGFVQPHVQRRHSFGAVTGQYFSDAGSGTKAGRFGIEGARGILRGELEYAGYAEPTATTIDRLHTFRLAVGIQPRLGAQGYFIAAVGVRGLVLNNGGQSAGGPEGELGVQLLPRKPFGVNITGRAALMTWEATTSHFGLEELNTTGSVFVNRMELQAGWHWMKVGSAPAFGGPVVGMRLWF